MNEPFAARVVAWQRRHGRHDLPWQGTRDPYLVWLSEIMLQQTQVSAVIPYFERFRARLPTIDALARADADEVLGLWAGLGYYSRARNLHRAARVVVETMNGEFPSDRERIEALPGVGRSTAAAIAAFAFGRREAILDGNVKRVFARHFGIDGFPGEQKVERALWEIAERELPEADVEAYAQGLMDLGATLCTRSRPDCVRCPVAASCVALRDDRVAALPAPRPKKTRPVRRTLMIVFVAGDRVLIEQRPASGIWGGLWSFPEAADEAEARVVCRDRVGHLPREMIRMPEVKHGFTHFQLEIVPVLVSVGGAPRRVADAGCRWLDLRDAASAPIPVPVKKILESLRLTLPGMSPD